MVVANCKQCNRIFQRRLGPLCPECHQQSMSKVSHVYRFVQEHPDLSLEDIAAQCDIPFKELETMLFEGKLGTAASKVKYQCQRCGLNMSALQRRGRFCYNCAERIEHEAGLDAVAEEKQEKKPASARDREKEPQGPGRASPHLPAEKERRLEEVARHVPEEAYEAAGGECEEPASPIESHGFKRLSG